MNNLGLWGGGITKPPPGATINRNHPLARGLVGCWLFNERSTAYALNICRDSYDKIYGAKVVSTGLEFNTSTTDYVDIPYAPWNAQTKYLSAIVYIFKYPTNDYGQFIGKRSGSTYDWTLRYVSPSLSFLPTSGGSLLGNISISSDLKEYCLGFTYNNGAVNLYVNSVNCGSASGKTITDNSLNLRIGSYVSGTLAAGIYHQVYYWNRELTPDEIKLLYASPYCFLNANPYRKYFILGGVIKTIAADLTTTSDMACVMAADRPIIANLVATSDLGSVVNATRPIIANLQATSDLGSVMSATRNIASNLNTTSDFATIMSATRPLAINLTTTADMVCFMSRIKTIAADLIATADLTIDITSIIEHVVTIAANLDSTADLTCNIGVIRGLVINLMSLMNASIDIKAIRKLEAFIEILAELGCAIAPTVSTPEERLGPMPNIYTAEQLLVSIRNLGMIPDTGLDGSSDADILNHVNEEISLNLVPYIMRTREEYLTITTRIQLVDGTTKYRFPHRAIGNTLRFIRYVDNSGTRSPIDEIGQAHLHEADWSSTTKPEGYYIEGNYICLVGSTFSGWLEITWFFRPGDLVLSTQARQILSIDGKTITCVSAIPTSWTTANKFDIHSFESGAEIKVWDQVATSVGGVGSTTKITFSGAIDGSVFGTHPVVAGDWVCLEMEAAVPAVPRDLHPLLIRMSTQRCNESKGDMNMVQMENALTQNSQNTAQSIMRNRQGKTPSLKGKGGPLWR